MCNWWRHLHRTGNLCGQQFVCLKKQTKNKQTNNTPPQKKKHKQTNKQTKQNIPTLQICTLISNVTSQIKHWFLSQKLDSYWDDDWGVCLQSPFKYGAIFSSDIPQLRSSSLRSLQSSTVSHKAACPTQSPDVVHSNWFGPQSVNIQKQKVWVHINSSPHWPNGVIIDHNLLRIKTSAFWHTPTGYHFVMFWMPSWRQNGGIPLFKTNRWSSLAQICSRSIGVGKMIYQLNNACRSLQNDKQFLSNWDEQSTYYGYLVHTNESIYVCKCVKTFVPMLYIHAYLHMQIILCYTSSMY